MRKEIVMNKFVKYLAVKRFVTDAFNYINKNIVNGALDDVKLIITEDENEFSSYLYRYDDVTGAVENPRIRICIEEYNCKDDFQTRHYWEEFGLKLEHEYLVVLLRMLCHEIGHHLTVDIYKDKEEEYMCALNDLHKYRYGTEERKRAYRMIPEEYAADECAVKILSIHLNRLLALYRD